jgi:hypothetical protein
MSARLAFIVASLLLYPPTQATEKQENLAGGRKPLKGDYWI